MPLNAAALDVLTSLSSSMSPARMLSPCTAKPEASALDLRPDRIASISSHH
jgi:hypothetical protein